MSKFSAVWSCANRSNQGKKQELFSGPKSRDTWRREVLKTQQNGCRQGLKKTQSKLVISLKSLTLVRHRDNVTANKLQCSRERGIWTARKHAASSHGANAQKWLLDEVKTFLCLLSMRGSQTDRTSSVGQALLSRAELSRATLSCGNTATKSFYGSPVLLWRRWEWAAGSRWED